MKIKTQRHTHNHTGSCFCSRCVIRIIFGVFSLFVLVPFSKISEGGNPAARTSQQRKKSCRRNSYSHSRPLWQHEIQLQTISHLAQVQEQESSRKKTLCGGQVPASTHLHTQRCTLVIVEAQIIQTTPTCVCATGVVPLFS